MLTLLDVKLSLGEAAKKESKTPQQFHERCHKERQASKMTSLENSSWHDPMCINHRTQHMFNLVYPQQPGGWEEALLIMMNQQFAVYPDSSTTSSNPMPSSAEIVPPTATKIHTLTQMKTTSSPLNHDSLTLCPSSVCSDSAGCLCRRNHSSKSIYMQNVT